MAINAEISDIWNATIFKHIQNHYIIKNANYNSNIAPGDKISFGFTMKLNGKAKFPEEFYMPIKTDIVNPERYEINIETPTSWETGYEYKISIKNNSLQAIEDWIIEFDFNNDISSLWDSTIVSQDSFHYVLTNNGYNSIIAPGESVSFGFISNSIYPENISVNEITSDGIKIAEKLIDSINFTDFNIITTNYKITPLYTLSGQISAYLVQYYNEDNFIGYIIVSNEINCKNYYIEFGLGSADIIYKIIDSVETEFNEIVDKVIYVGGHTYYVLVKDNIYTFNNFELQKLTEDEIQQLNSLTRDTIYYEKYVALSLADIYAKEVGYATVTSTDAPKETSFVYKTMDDTRNAYLNKKGVVIKNHCAPTAGINMFLYWKQNGYSKLASDWESDFCNLHAAMYSTNSGTFRGDCQTGYRSVITNNYSQYNYTISTLSYTAKASWNQITAAIDKGAIHLHLDSSQIYGDHDVLALGYIDFVFSTGYTSKYFKIADGWNSGFRYVNNYLGINYIGMTIFVPAIFI